MARSHRLLAGVSAFALAAAWAQLGAPPPPASAATGATGSTGSTGNTGTQTLTAAQRRELWATIDVCNAADAPPHTIGVRGSMPGDGDAHVQMYMRFRLQYESPTGTWVDLAAASDAAFVPVGSGKSSRQGGATFVLKPVAGEMLMLRGVVTFQWRNGTTVLEQLSRPTSAGRKSLAGADPPGFSAATCPLS
jgi:hypothetical protein